MTLSSDAYRTFEDIVGPENVSDDPALCDTYAFQLFAETARPDQSRFMPRPVAVLMPRSVEEIQAIVKACNQYKIKVKPYSTGWWFYGAPQKDEDDTIQLDLRRMDRILEIDEKNMFVVVEPYVICGTLQAELMKLGFDINVIGGGASTSPLASATSFAGTGDSTIWAGNNSENLLGLEWVTPGGDILRTGSLGYGAGWFCGEGSGPSLRGLCRGRYGARGGLGIYTKCAIKITHWPGPRELPIKGTMPAFRSPIPDNLRVYAVGMPSWRAYADALYKIYDNEIGYHLARELTIMGGELGAAFWLMYNDPTKTLSDIEEIARKPEVKKLAEEMSRSFHIVLAGRSISDIEYQDRVLDQILVDTGGWKIARMCEPDLAEAAYLYFYRAGSRHLAHVYAGGWLGHWAMSATPDYSIKYHPAILAGSNRDHKSGLLVQCGDDATYAAGSFIGGGGSTDFEHLVYYDPANKESVKAVVKLMHDGQKDQFEQGFVPGREILELQVAMDDEQIHKQLANSSQPGVFRLQGKIKQLLDPNDIGDRMYVYLPVPKK